MHLIYTGGTEIFSCVKILTQDLQKIPMYYILEEVNDMNETRF